jgi:hypothetical protein
MSDAAGDACDDDDDNDGRSDVDETTGSACSGHVTDPLVLDSDGDHLGDGWECANGSDPTDPASRFLGPPATTDADADGVLDIVEVRGYSSAPGSVDSDGDGCNDVVEIGSIDGDRALNSTDRLILARRIAWPTAPQYPPEPVQDAVLDINKDGHVNGTDQLMLDRWVYLTRPAPCL